MNKKTIVFIKDPEQFELGASDPIFKTGDRVELRADKAERWIRRGKAVLADASGAVAEFTLTADPAVEIPENWTRLGKGKKIDLATALFGPEFVQAKQDGEDDAGCASRLIEAEVAARANAAKASQAHDSGDEAEQAGTEEQQSGEPGSPQDGTVA